MYKSQICMYRRKVHPNAPLTPTPITHRIQQTLGLTELCVSTSLSEVDFVTPGKDGEYGPDWFFLVKKSGLKYTLVQASNHATQSCEGANRLATVLVR